MTTTNLGLDIATTDDGDLDPMFTEVSGPLLVAQDLRAELTTREGTLFYDAEYGFDVRALVAARVTPDRRAELTARVEAVCLRDDRVAVVEISVTSPTRDSLVIAVDGVTSTQEPFRFVVDVGQVAARLSLTP